MNNVEFTIEVDIELYEEFKEICVRESIAPGQAIITFIKASSNENNIEQIKKMLKDDIK